MAEPDLLIQGHDGPAYDVKFYGHGEDSLLLRFVTSFILLSTLHRRLKHIVLDFPFEMNGSLLEIRLVPI